MKLDKESRLKTIREEYRKGMHVLELEMSNDSYFDRFDYSLLIDIDVVVFSRETGMELDGSDKHFKFRVYKGRGAPRTRRLFLRFFKTEKEMLDTARGIYLKLLAGYKVEELPNNVNDLIEIEGFKIEDYL